jgi:hypothetical protein
MLRRGAALSSGTSELDHGQCVIATGAIAAVPGVIAGRHCSRVRRRPVYKTAALPAELHRRLATLETTAVAAGRSGSPQHRLASLIRRVCGRPFTPIASSGRRSLTVPAWRGRWAADLESVLEGNPSRVRTARLLHSAAAPGSCVAQDLHSTCTRSSWLPHPLRLSCHATACDPQSRSAGRACLQDLRER